VAAEAAAGTDAAGRGDGTEHAVATVVAGDAQCDALASISAPVVRGVSPINIVLEVNEMPFKPDELTAEGELKVPYFASQGKEIPGRGTHKSQKQLQEEIRALMMRVGAGMVEFKAGHWEESDRYGFQVIVVLVIAHMVGNDLCKAL